MKIDWHVHSTFSDGADTVIALLEKAQSLRLESIAITDHFDPHDKELVNRAATEKDILKHFESIRALAASYPFEVFCGIETCSDANGTLLIDNNVLQCADIVITSPHYIEYEGQLTQGELMNDAFWAAYKQKVLKMAAGPGDVLGHAEAYLPFKPMLPPISTFEERLQFSREIVDTYFDEEYIHLLGQALLSSGKAYELHGMSNSPRLWVIQHLHKMGVSFSIGSDAHSASNLGCNRRAWQIAEEMQLKIKYPKHRF